VAGDTMCGLVGIALVIGMIVLGYPEFNQCRHEGGDYFSCTLVAIWVGDIEGPIFLISSAFETFSKEAVSWRLRD
jgi:hypothetical protein